MITRIGLAPMASGLSRSEAIDHWRTTHAEVALHIPGLRRYVQLHPVLDGDRHLLGYPGFDICALTGFDDLAAMDEGFASDAYQQAVVADEQRLIRREHFALLLGESIAGGPPIDEQDALAVAFLRRRAGVDGATFRDAVRTAVTDAGPAGWELVLGIDADGRAGQLDGDALLLVAADGPDDARDWLLADDGLGGIRHALAGAAFGVERFVAAPNKVR